MSERDRQSNAIRTYEGDLHAMQLRESTLTNQIRDKTALEERVETMQKEITAFTARTKVGVDSDRPPDVSD